MTIYFRPDRIEYTYPTKSNQSFKDDQEHYNITLDLVKVVDGKGNNLIDYHLDQINYEFLHKGKFIGISVNGKYCLEITPQLKNRQEEKDKVSVILDFQEEIAKFKGCKNDIYTKEIKIGDYVVFCSYGYNKFLEVCGMSKFYEFTIEPSGVIQEKMKKIHHDTFISATKGLNQDSHVSKLVDKTREKSFQGEEKSMYKEERNEEEKRSQHQSEYVKYSVESEKEKYQDEVNVEPEHHQKSNKPKKIKEELTFYKGPCKTTNFFSCLDPRPNVAKEYSFIEKSYD